MSLVKPTGVYEQMNIEKNLISFGQLLTIKREKMGLSVTECANKSKIWSISDYEKDKRMPTKELLKRIKDFFKLTDEEIKSCRKAPKHKELRLQFSVPQIPKVSQLINLLKELIKHVDTLHIDGEIGNKLQLDCLDGLSRGLKHIEQVQIIDRLL